MIICKINVDKTRKKGVFCAQMGILCAGKQQFFRKKFA